VSELLAAHPGLNATAVPRARLLAAMSRVSADRGYANATVADVVRAAGVSRSTFYEEFASKEELFVEAVRHGLEVLDARVAAAVRGADDWRAQLRAGIRAYLEALQEDRAFARACLVEIHAAGPAAAAVHAEAVRGFADRYARSGRAARRAGGARRTPPAEALLVLCAGTEQLLVERLRAQADPTFTDLEDVFCDCAESLLLGPADTDERT
jgi:AcrR family transcriptional regulator